MNDLTLTVQVIPGTTITHAAEQAITIAQRLSCGVDFDFNGVKCSVTYKSTPEALEKSFHLALEGKTSYKMAWGNP